MCQICTKATTGSKRPENSNAIKEGAIAFLAGNTEYCHIVVLFHWSLVSFQLWDGGYQQLC
jgi:hypothetical protein